jgi:multiple sugar transport system ATP-binding protein
MMDEPLGALDAEFREHMAEELRALHDRMNATTVYVTHDQLEAMQMGDKIVVMNNAVVEQFGSPQEVYDKPASLFVADFIGSPSMNFLRFNGSIEPGTTSVELASQKIKIPRQLQGARGDLVFGVRPEKIVLSDAGMFRGEILAVEYLGTTQIVTLQTASGVVKARINASQDAVIGEQVGLGFESESITLFEESSGKAIVSVLNNEVLGGV